MQSSGAAAAGFGDGFGHGLSPQLPPHGDTAVEAEQPLLRPASSFFNITIYVKS